MGRPHTDSGIGPMKRTQAKTEEAKSIENEEKAVLQIQQRTGNVRIDSGGQSKPMNTACYSMLNGSRVAVK